MPDNRLLVPNRPSLTEELEHAIRERGVRVEERLALLHMLAEEKGPERIRALAEENVAAVRRAAANVKGELA